MSVEKEMKFKVESFESIKHVVLDNGFVLEKEIIQEDLYFSPPHKNFAGTKKYYLRLRKDTINNRFTFAYHKVINDLETDETEVEIDNFENFLKILKELDFNLDCIVNKKRKVYRGDVFEIVLDEIKDLGFFIEIEYVGEETKNTDSLFNEIIKKLGLKKENLISGVGYPDLIGNSLT